MNFSNLITFFISIFLFNIITYTHADNNLVTLTDNNFVVLRGQIDEDTSSYFIRDIHQLISYNNDIYVYLITPGGSVIDGYNIIQTLDALSLTGKNIHCIADIAYSMGFSILQACNYRYVLQGSSIMQHQMSFGLEGQLENNKNRFKFIESIEEKMAEQQSAKLGLTKDEFQKKILSDWWLFGDNAVKENAADNIINVMCDLTLLNETYFREFDFIFFGKVKFEFSKCPLIKAPISINFMDKVKNDEFDYTTNTIASQYINPITKIYK